MKCILCYSVRVVWDTQLLEAALLLFSAVPVGAAQRGHSCGDGSWNRAGLGLGFPLCFFFEVSTQFPSSLCFVAPQACAGIGKGRELLLQLFQFTAARYNVF